MTTDIYAWGSRGDDFMPMASGRLERNHNPQNYNADYLLPDEGESYPLGEHGSHKWKT